jgi:hypothetical protein
VPANLLMRLNAALHGLTGGLVHPDKEYGKQRVEHYFPRVFSWICALCSCFNWKLSSLLTLKYVARCPYCGDERCTCIEHPRERDPDRNRKLLEDVRDRWRPVMPEPKSFSDYFSELEHMYGHNDASASEVSRHAFAEVAEAMDALLRIDALRRHDDIVILRLEIADIIAWFFALLRVYLREEQGYFFPARFSDFYANGCYACAEIPCNCPEVDPELNMSTWRNL